MSMNIQRIEVRVLAETHHHQRSHSFIKSLITKWWLLLINCTLLAIGGIGGPLLIRLYFLQGGNRKWLSGWLQTSGFPILLIPISTLYLRHQHRCSSSNKFFASPKFLLCGSGVGLLIGLDSFMYSLGLSFLPVSTSSLLFATQLAFTAFFALILARHKFTPYSINAVVLMTMGSVLLGIRKNSDRPPGVTSAQYLLGFLFTIGAACLLGFIMPCTEVAFTKACKNITYSSVLQFQFCASVFSTLFCTIGMLINRDFAVIPREAREFGLGASKYYLVLASTAVLWQFTQIGSMGLIFCASSLATGVFNASLLPLTEIAAVIVYHENFNGEKGMALALCIWGFASYFYGSYRDSKKQTGDQIESK